MIQSLSTIVTRLCSLNRTRKHRCKSSFESRFFNLHVGEKLDSLAGFEETGTSKDRDYCVLLLRNSRGVRYRKCVSLLGGLCLLFGHTFRVPEAKC